MMIAQHQTEATRSPSITSLTTKWACQNRLNRDKSWATGAAWAMSAGFMSFVLVVEPPLIGGDGCPLSLRRSVLVRIPARSTSNLSK